MTDRATAFIRTNSSEWGFAHEIITDAETTTGVPTITDIPVIACIGTSRDGKSTLLNALYKKISRGFATPFISKNGTEHVTNGIDYFIIPNQCMLLDCQGMAMKDAKHDHFLSLIVYHIANVIILNVRQQLDLQVLNNLLSVFSFLSEMPDEARRRDKPTLVIRLKDFQDMEAYERDRNYLKKYVGRWLTKSGDQYDHIKEAFSISFNIEIVVTEYPEFTNKRTKFIDVHDKKFFTENPTYSDICDTIICIAKSCMPVHMLKNKDLLTKFIVSLQQNHNIDYKKLDLYYNVTSIELEKYVNESLNIAPFNDEQIIEKMDGSLAAYNLYDERTDLVNRLYTTTYDVKFKNISRNLKGEIFGRWFQKFYEIIVACENKNIDIALEKIKPAYDIYRNKFKIARNKGLFEQLACNIIKIFTDHRDELYKQLKLLDQNVQDGIIKEINGEELELIYKQYRINLYNEERLHKIVESIERYDPEQKICDYVKRDLQNDINADDLLTCKVMQMIENDIIEIHKDYKMMWYLNGNGDIAVCGNMPCYVDRYMPDKPNSEVYWALKNKYLTAMIFIPHNETFTGTAIHQKSSHLCLANNEFIKFVRLRISDYSDTKVESTYILMTLPAYVKFHKTVIVALCNEYKFVRLKQFDSTHPNLRELSYELPEKWHCPSLYRVINDRLLSLIAMYAHDNNVTLHCYCIQSKFMRIDTQSNSF